MNRTPYKTKHKTRFTLREMFAMYIKTYKPVVKCKSVSDWKFERQLAKHSNAKPHRSAIGLSEQLTTSPIFSKVLIQMLNLINCLNIG